MFFDMPARPSGEIGVVEVQKLRLFCFLKCPRGPLRGSAWSRCKTRGVFCVFCGARATPSGDRRGRGAKSRGLFVFLPCPRDPLRRSCVSKRSRCAPCDFVAREMACGSCLVVCAPAFAIPQSRVRFPPGPRQLRLEFKYRRSMRSVLPQLRLENRNF